MSTSVTVITPWRDAHELAAGYWQAIEAGLAPHDRVIIIDNGSSPTLRDAYFERTGHGLPAFATILRSSVNLGFSRACNAAMQRVGTDAILFLNNDIRLRDAGWLDHIKRALEPGTLVGAHLRHDPHTAVDGETIPYLDGWCLAGMTSDLHGLGGWDDLEEPSYYGDNLLCARASAAGMRLRQVTVGLRHLENYTSRRLDLRDEVAERNRAVYEAEVRRLRNTVAA
ncbi:MAG: glycosyltransferase [Candidatus Nanopelagicales bacterium]